MESKVFKIDRKIWLAKHGGNDPLQQYTAIGTSVDDWDLIESSDVGNEGDQTWEPSPLLKANPIRSGRMATPPVGLRVDTKTFVDPVKLSQAKVLSESETSRLAAHQQAAQNRVDVVRSPDFSSRVAELTQGSRRGPVHEDVPPPSRHAEQKTSEARAFLDVAASAASQLAEPLRAASIPSSSSDLDLRRSSDEPETSVFSKKSVVGLPYSGSGTLLAHNPAALTGPMLRNSIALSGGPILGPPLTAQGRASLLASRQTRRPGGGHKVSVREAMAIGQYYSRQMRADQLSHAGLSPVSSVYPSRDPSPMPRACQLPKS